MNTIFKTSDVIFISFFGESETGEGYKNSEKSKTAVQNRDDKMGRSFIGRFMFTKLRTPDCYITM